jgi:hypothetical protein
MTENQIVEPDDDLSESLYSYVQGEESTIGTERIGMEIPSSTPSGGEDARKIGAGIAIGIVAAPIVGPALAVVAGVGGAYGTTQTGAAGDACRAAGDVALLARDKAVEVNNKHDIVNKTKDGANDFINTAKEAESQNHFFEKVQEVVKAAIANIVSFIKFAVEKINNNDDDKEKSDVHTKSDEPVPARVHVDGVVS